MKKIPLLFTKENRAVVRAGIKTETRRKFSLLGDRSSSAEELQSFAKWAMADPKELNGILKDSPYGCPQLAPVRYWMREPVQVVRRDGLIASEDVSEGFDECVLVLYPDGGKDWRLITEKDGQRLDARKDWTRPTSSLHMLKAFTRTWLTGRRVYPERLGDITPEGAIAEGIELDPSVVINQSDPWERLTWAYSRVWRDYLGGGHDLTPVQSYASQWERINGPGSWDPDEVVWVIQFALES